MIRVTTALSPTGGGPANARSAGAEACGRSATARVFLRLFLPVAATALGCRVHSAGLSASGGAGDLVPAENADLGGNDEPLGDQPDDDPDSHEVDAGEPVDLTPVFGSPSIIGCSDGSREGFRAITDWPDVAGCAGGWQVPGLLADASRRPACNRAAGNHSRNPDGTGCSAADLCAPTWHACLDGPEVARRSPASGCTGIVSPGEQAFFVVMAGASHQGVCYPDPSATNDLHGCGSIGQPESGDCAPLNRRMDFADCMATGVWQCGTAQESLDEANVVTKPGSSLGGVLCCKD